ncbi:Clp protease N-terminal domain-containing protein [Rathayibacter sp. CAU 1779]
MADFPVSLDNLIAFVEALHADGDPLRHLSDAVTISNRVQGQADALIGYFVDQARRSGASWTQIGESMGVTKQAAQKRFVSKAQEYGLPAPSSAPLQRFTQRARNVLVAARRITADGEVEPRHLVAALLTEPEAVAAVVIHELGVTDDALIAAMNVPSDRLVKPAEASPADGEGAVLFGGDAKRLLAHALDVALHYGHNYIGTEHLLLSAASEGPTVEPLAALGLDADRLSEAVEAKLDAIVKAPRVADDPAGE